MNKPSESLCTAGRRGNIKHGRFLKTDHAVLDFQGIDPDLEDSDEGCQ
jgi:hypothetical protein